MKKETIEKLEKYLKNFDFDLIPNDQIDIDYIEKSLNIKINNDYKEFLLIFGGCFVGLPIYGVKNCKLLEDITVVQLTNDFRADGVDLNVGCYVISMDGSGNPIYLNSSNHIMIYDHDLGKEKVFEIDFENMILNAID